MRVFTQTTRRQHFDATSGTVGLFFSTLSIGRQSNLMWGQKSLLITTWANSKEERSDLSARTLWCWDVLASVVVHSKNLRANRGFHIGDAWLGGVKILSPRHQCENP